jgi:hypothetical protein
MTTPLSGYSSTFPRDVVIDSGVLYLGDAVFGVFRGGLKFDPGTTIRPIDFDGKRGPVMGLDRVTNRTSKITGTLLELPVARLDALEPGGSSGSGWSAGDAFYPRKADALLTEGMYLENVRAIWLRGNGEFVQVRFPKALLVKYDATSQDADELAIAVEVEARLDLTVEGSTPGDAPYVIEYLEAV